MSCLRSAEPRPTERLIQFALLCSGLMLLSAGQARAGSLTNVQTVFLIVMENRDWTAIQGNTNCPYINDTLLPMASLAQRYFTPPNLHPSEPNYIWLEAGTNFGILDDGPPALHHIGSTNHLVTLLEDSGVSWKSYQEDYHDADNPLLDNYPYVARHNPFIFFDDVATNIARWSSHVRPYSELAELHCRTDEEMVEQANQTLLHEIGHYLGLDEKRLRDLGVG